MTTKKYFVVLGLTALMPIAGTPMPVFGFFFLFCVFYPSIAFGNVIWKTLRYNYFPTPMQLMRGLKRQWPNIKRGPVVTRVKRLP